MTIVLLSFASMQCSRYSVLTCLRTEQGSLARMQTSQIVAPAIADRIETAPTAYISFEQEANIVQGTFKLQPKTSRKVEIVGSPF